MAKKKNGISREQAAEIYSDLQTAMARMLKNEADHFRKQGKEPPKNPKGFLAPSQKRALSADLLTPREVPVRRAGQRAAIFFVLLFALGKVTLSGLEYSGIAAVKVADASIAKTAQAPVRTSPRTGYSSEEMQILTSLDTRRADLEKRSVQLDEREQDLARRDRELAGRITQLRDLTEKLSNERERSSKKRNAHLDQLSNVYSSMEPKEAAQLIEQLDIQIAISLIERMPEKRIGQILASMTPERALSITRLLSSKAGSAGN